MFSFVPQIALNIFNSVGDIQFQVMCELQFLIFANGNHGALYCMGLFEDKTEKCTKRAQCL